MFPALLVAQTPPAGRGNAGGTRRSFEKLTGEGQPIDKRPPELDSDHPVFPGQTHAPYHKTTDVAVTTIACADSPADDGSLGYFPDGKGDAPMSCDMPTTAIADAASAALTIARTSSTTVALTWLLKMIWP